MVDSEKQPLTVSTNLVKPIFSGAGYGTAKNNPGGFSTGSAFSSVFKVIFMFDEDEMGSVSLYISRPFIADDQVEDAMAEAEALDLPFDLTNVIDYNPFVYGRLGVGQDIGKWVYYKGGTVTNLNGDSSDILPGVAMVVGHEFGRYVLGFENERTGWVYLGWVLPESIDFLHIHYENSRWTH